MLAAHTQTLLGGCGPGVVPLLLPLKNLLELDHTRVGKKQGRVVPGDERGTWLTRMTFIFEIFEKFLADLCSGYHNGFSLMILKFLTSRLTNLLPISLPPENL
jgi:hypothetical protein